MKDLKEVPKKVEQEKPLKDKPEETLLKKETESEEYSVEITRDYYGKIDPFYLSQTDSNYSYRFLRDEHKNISIKTSNLLFQKGGWQLCPREHLLRIGIKDREISPDGLLRRGDTVLAFIPKKLLDEKNQYKKEKAEEPMRNINRQLKEGIPSVGGVDIHESMKGIQTGKQLGMK